MELYNIGIEEYKEKYKITKDGNVWSCKANRFLKSCINSGNNYLYVKLQKQKYYIHRLVAQTFIENPNNCYSVDHIDNDITNNHVHNLRWATRQQQQFNRSCNTPIIWSAVKNGKINFYWEKKYNGKIYKYHSIDLAKVEEFREETMKYLYDLEPEKITGELKNAEYYDNTDNLEDKTTDNL